MMTRSHTSTTMPILSRAELGVDPVTPKTLKVSLAIQSPKGHWLPRRAACRTPGDPEKTAGRHSQDCTAGQGEHALRHAYLSDRRGSVLRLRPAKGLSRILYV